MSRTRHWRVAATGKVVWRETPMNETPGGTRQDVLSTYRGSLLAVDGCFLCLGEFDICSGWI